MCAWKYFTMMATPLREILVPSSVLPDASNGKGVTLLSPYYCVVDREDSWGGHLVSLIMLRVLGGLHPAASSHFHCWLNWLSPCKSISLLLLKQRKINVKKTSVVLIFIWQQVFNILILKWYTWIITWTRWPSATRPAALTTGRTGRPSVTLPFCIRKGSVTSTRQAFMRHFNIGEQCWVCSATLNPKELMSICL